MVSLYTVGLVAVGASVAVSASEVAAPLKTPTVVFHGFTAHCKGAKDEGIAEHIAKVTGAYAECVEIAAPFDDPEQASLVSVFDNMNHYVAAACESVKANPHF